MMMGDSDAMLDDMARQIDEQLQQAERMKSRVEATSVTVTSRGGEVTVTVNSSGGLSGLRLDDSAARLRPAELAELILSTSKQAQARLAEQMGQIATSIYGESETADFITGVYAKQYPAQADDEERGGYEGDRR